MTAREATCHCGQLRLHVMGDPFGVSVCNCFACQRRTGSAFGIQAGFNADQVKIVGRFTDYSRVSDGPDGKEHIFHFCPVCGSQVFYTEPTEPNLVVVSVDSFADPSFPPPTESGYDHRRHPWVGLPNYVRRMAQDSTPSAGTRVSRADTALGAPPTDDAVRSRNWRCTRRMACCMTIRSRLVV